MSQIIEIGYTNHRGEWSKRRLIPIRVWYGSTAWHGPQWLLEAFDLDKSALRDFALKDFGVSPRLAPQLDINFKVDPTEAETTAEMLADVIREKFQVPVSVCATARPPIELLAGPSTHICWTPDNTPVEERELVALVRVSDLERLALPHGRKRNKPAEYMQVSTPSGDTDIFKEVAEVYARREAEGRDPSTGVIVEPSLAHIPGFAAWDEEEGEFVNRKTGLTLGHEFKYKWEERRGEFPVWDKLGWKG